MFILLDQMSHFRGQHEVYVHESQHDSNPRSRGRSRRDNREREGGGGGVGRGRGRGGGGGGGGGGGRGHGRGRGYNPHHQPYHDEGAVEQGRLQGETNYCNQGAVGFSICIGPSGGYRGHSGGGGGGGGNRHGNHRQGHGNHRQHGHGYNREDSQGRSGTHNEHDSWSESRGNGHRPPTQKSTRCNHDGEHEHGRPYQPQGPLQISGRAKYLSQKEISQLACGDFDNLIAFITENEGVFLATYSQPRCCSHPLTLKYLIKLLYLLVKSEDDLASRIVAYVFNDTDSTSQGTSAFRSNLEVLIRRMPAESNPRFRQENQQYLKYIIEIGAYAIRAAPTSVLYTFPCPSLNHTVQILSQDGGETLRLLAEKVQELDEEFTRAQVHSRSTTASRGKQTDSKDQPPQHFTELPVLPSTDEVHPHARKPFVRPNVTKGAYTDWEHYLDVQFRLMREDFIAPLREGIKHYELHGAKSKEVMVYEGASVGSTVCLHSGVGFHVRFDVTRFQRINWAHSKRLIFGSLLCLSDDGFYTIFLATVIKRDPKLLKDVVVIVQFEINALEEVLQIDPSRRFTMVESTAYFEAYRHILEGLQRASAENLTDQLPIFKRYLVDCRLNSPIPAPRYIRVSENSEFRLKKVLGIADGINPNVVLTADWSWPADKYTSLDPSQLSAFRAALTQEMSVIQGPPGTGKTFIGLKVVEALVANQSKSSHFPLLVLCYTNHALDQFLDGILDIKEKFSKDLNIVRIGGRCKTEGLKDCILNSKIKEIRSQRALPKDLHKEDFRLNKEIRSYQERIQCAQESVDATSENKDKIFKLSALKDIIHHNHFSQLTELKPTLKSREIDAWLKLWYVQEDEDENQPFADELYEYHEPDEGGSGDDQSDSDTNDEYIDVDAEAYMLEDERMMEGEEFELPMNRRIRSELYAADTYNKQQKDDAQWNIAQISKKERQIRIRKGHSYQPMTKSEVNSVKDIRKLNIQKRWSLYLHWVDELIKTQKKLIADTVRMYNEVCKEYTTCRQEIDAFVIQNSDIIGMTTTGAAKYNHILSNIHPKIVIIEEAAEVFEAHVFTSLTPSVQQLIMIGDHKQLRPKANSYYLEKEYGLCISLFERLALNGFPVHSLEVQHRMRPEIASLICPTIYEKLLNHKDVEKYEHVKGVGSDVFFIDHSKPEKDKEKSHSNEHEADFIAALCKYLLKQGYEPKHITVLTMYSGQLLELKKRMKREDFNGVRVAAVDDFQGEENEIILLSLVRSNPDGKIGFLEIENRICVSLSRAKIGLYVIGNMSMLRDKDHTVWPQILTDLSRKGCTGKALPLQCQVHPKSIVKASSSSDFLKCPERGCQQKCAARLTCGHSCPRLCHPIDKEHKNVTCQQMCAKNLHCGHNCEQKCYKCKDGCPPCTKLVVKRLYPCGHEVKMPCNEDPSTFPCPRPCRKLLNCGHICQEICSRPCTRYCRVDVEKELPCGHIGRVSCFTNESTVMCEMPCEVVLDCGHQCAGNCSWCQEGRLHVRCKSKCGRTLVCGHQCDFPCTPTCPPCMEKCNNYCVHSKCQLKCYEPCVPCKEKCKWKCEHFRCTQPCGEICNRPPCNEPCKKILKCGHPCIGLCGEKCPRKCRICNKEEVCEIFFGNEVDEDAQFIELEDCKHLIEVSACDTWRAQAADESKPSEVQFKCCPKCNTQIRKSLRYGNIIKQTLQDYEIIKAQQLVSLSSDLVQKFVKVQDEIAESISPILAVIREKLEQIKQTLQPFNNNHKSQPLLPHQINDVNVQLTYLSTIVKIVKHLMSLQSTADAYRNSANVNEGIKDIQDGVMVLIDFLMQDFLSDQQKSDIKSEIYRLMGLTKLLDLGCKTENVNLSESDGQTLTTLFVRVHESGWKLDKLTEKEYDDIIEFITKISAKYGVSGLTDSEKTDIVKAIGLAKGHWFKCPNGHFYCIGECGGAMEAANCPECGARIGGQRHTLRADNQLASEMDGAQHAAWPYGRL